MIDDDDEETVVIEGGDSLLRAAQMKNVVDLDAKRAERAAKMLADFEAVYGRESEELHTK